MRRRWLILAVPLMAACGGGKVTPSNDTVEAQAVDQMTARQVLAIDLVWPQYRDSLCPAFRDTVGDGLPSEAVKRDMISAFEAGYEHTLTPTAAAHLIGLFEECP